MGRRASQQESYVAFARLPGDARRSTVLVIGRVSATTLRVYGRDGRLYDLPPTVVGRPRRSAAARVQATRLRAQYAQLTTLLEGLRPHARGRRVGVAHEA